MQQSAVVLTPALVHGRGRTGDGLKPPCRKGCFESCLRLQERTGRLASQAIGGLTKIQSAEDIMEDLMVELVDALQTDHMAIKATAEVIANATSGKL